MVSKRSYQGSGPLTVGRGTRREGGGGERGGGSSNRGEQGEGRRLPAVDTRDSRRQQIGEWRVESGVRRGEPDKSADVGETQAVSVGSEGE